MVGGVPPSGNPGPPPASEAPAAPPFPAAPAAPARPALPPAPAFPPLLPAFPPAPELPPEPEAPPRPVLPPEPEAPPPDPALPPAPLPEVPPAFVEPELPPVPAPDAPPVPAEPLPPPLPVLRVVFVEPSSPVPQAMNSPKTEATIARVGAERWRRCPFVFMVHPLVAPGGRVFARPRNIAGGIIPTVSIDASAERMQPSGRESRAKKAAFSANKENNHTVTFFASFRGRRCREWSPTSRPRRSSGERGSTCSSAHRPVRTTPAGEFVVTRARSGFRRCRRA
jgi:hypothetical protein